MNVKDQNTRLEEYKAGARRLAMRFILIGSLMIAGVGLFILSMTINFLIQHLLIRKNGQLERNLSKAVKLHHSMRLFWARGMRRTPSQRGSD